MLCPLQERSLGSVCPSVSFSPTGLWLKLEKFFSSKRVEIDVTARPVNYLQFVFWHPDPCPADHCASLRQNQLIRSFSKFRVRGFCKRNEWLERRTYRWEYDAYIVPFWQCRINPLGGPMPTWNGGPSNPPPFPLPLSFPSVPLEVGPLKYG